MWRHLFVATLAFLLYMPQPAAAHRQKPPELNPLPIVCDRIDVGLYEFTWHRVLLTMKHEMLSSDSPLSVPPHCYSWPLQGRILFPIRKADTVSHGMLVRSYFFIAYDHVSKHIVYVIQDVLLEERLA